MTSTPTIHLPKVVTDTIPADEFRELMMRGFAKTPDFLIGDVIELSKPKPEDGVFAAVVTGIEHRSGDYLLHINYRKSVCFETQSTTARPKDCKLIWRESQS